MKSEHHANEAVEQNQSYKLNPVLSLKVHTDLSGEDKSAVAEACVSASICFVPSKHEKKIDLNDLRQKLI